MMLVFFKPMLKARVKWHGIGFCMDKRESVGAGGLLYWCVD